MKIVEYAVKRYQFTIIIFLMLVVMGISAVFMIPKAEDPPLDFPVFSILAVYPGASPADMERLVVDKLEKKLKELEDIREIKTDIQDGVAELSIEFNADQSSEKKYEEVLRQVNAAKTDLPADIRQLEVIIGSTTNVSVMQVALVSEHATYFELEDLADKLKKRFESVPSVKTADYWAVPDQEVRVALDLEKIAQQSISVDQVMGAIQGSNANIPGGSAEAGRRKFNIKTSGEYESIEQIRNTVVGSGPSGLLHLRDVAAVTFQDGDHNYIGRFNGERAVFVTANMKKNQQIFKTADWLSAELLDFEKTLPPNVRLERGFDQSHNVAKRINALSFDLVLAILLVMITLLPLGSRASLIVMISIPLSLAMGVTLMYLTGFSINQLSIAGFVVALGLLVDDSIVVVENIARFIRNGYKPVEAAIAATRQIGLAVLGTTATLLFAFLPLLFLPGLPGPFIRSLPIAVVYAVLSSLIVALTIIPFLASVILRREKHEGGNVIYRTMLRWIHTIYRPVLHAALRRRWTTIGIAVALFVGSLMLIPAVGFSLFPKAGIPQFLITVDTPEGSNVEETDDAVRYVERTLKNSGAIKYYFSNVGKGNPRVYYNVIPRREVSNAGEVLAELKHFDADRSPVFIDSLRSVFAGYPNAHIRVQEFENGPPLDAPIAVRLIGDNLDSLAALARTVEAILEETEGTMYVNNPIRSNKTDLRIAVDRDRAGLYGVAPAQIDKTVRLAMAGLPAGKYRTDEGTEYDINVTLPRNRKQSPDALKQIYVASYTGAQVPLQQLGTTTFESSPTLIRHFNRERSITISAFTQTGYNTDRVTKTFLTQLEKLRLPSGFRIMPAGEIESRQDSFGGMGTAIIVALFGIFALLVLEFRTFRSTFIVLSVIPLGIIGGVLALLFSGYTLSFTAVIGFVALIGIEVKNSILLVDFTNQLRERGVALDEAIEQAGEIRFFPILLTTMTALCGLIPLALQNSAMYSPLAWVIIGGLISSTILTRVITPVMYKMFAPDITVRTDTN